MTTYTTWDEKPLDVAAAEAAGWTPASTDCSAGLGLPFVMQGGVTGSAPWTLYYSAGTGQVSGIGIEIWGDVPATLVDAGYFIEVSEGRYHIAVGLRSAASTVCDPSATSPYAEPVGDAAVVNPSTLAESLPLTEHEANLAGYYQGACFGSLGVHYFKDLDVPWGQSWTAAALHPIVLMYHPEGADARGAVDTQQPGSLNSFFFASSVPQVSMDGLLACNEGGGKTRCGGWDVVPLPNPFMCTNWCEDPGACYFSDTNAWSTGHVWVHDVTSATSAVVCPADWVCKSTLAVLANNARGGRLPFMPPGLAVSCCPAN